MGGVLASLGARCGALFIGKTALLDQPVGGEALRLERLDLSQGVLQAKHNRGKKQKTVNIFISHVKIRKSSINLKRFYQAECI